MHHPIPRLLIEKRKTSMHFKKLSEVGNYYCRNKMTCSTKKTIPNVPEIIGIAPLLLFSCSEEPSFIKCATRGVFPNNLESVNRGWMRIVCLCCVWHCFRCWRRKKGTWHHDPRTHVIRFEKRTWAEAPNTAENAGWNLPCTYHRQYCLTYTTCPIFVVPTLLGIFVGI